MLAVAMIGALIFAIIPIIEDVLDRRVSEIANRALTLVLANQKDRALASGTVIKVGKRSFS